MTALQNYMSRLLSEAISRQPLSAVETTASSSSVSESSSSNCSSHSSVDDDETISNCSASFSALYNGDVTLVCDHHHGHWDGRRPGQDSDSEEPTSPISPSTEELLKHLPLDSKRSFLKRRRRRWQEHGTAVSHSDADDEINSPQQPQSRRNYSSSSLHMPKEPSRFVSPMPNKKKKENVSTLPSSPPTWDLYFSDSGGEESPYSSCSSNGSNSNNSNKSLEQGFDSPRKTVHKLIDVLPNITIDSPKKAFTTGKFPHAA
mmetsp:Transcript_27699/g.51980  ORF Transcript_27699/g.51980 Transcript_27699/m.51980 type:complete len:260 (-) Transcript_27699:109-888(-)